MKKLFIITGGNKGLGKELIDLAINDDDTFIISISRSLNMAHSNISKNKMVFLQKDLTTLQNVNKELNLRNFYNYEEIIFINNAATVDPINRIGQFDDIDIIRNFNLNTVSSLLLINNILKYNSKNHVRIFNISSGAANRAIGGWSLYCSTKAATKMFCEVLEIQEKENKYFSIYNFDPGVMDTQMQANIRNNNREEMPDVGVFKKLKDAGELKSPKDVASDFIRKYDLFKTEL